MDQNDNRPVFRQEVFTGRVLEGAVPGEPGGVPVGEGALPWALVGQKSRISRQRELERSFRESPGWREFPWVDSSHFLLQYKFQ